MHKTSEQIYIETIVESYINPLQNEIQELKKEIKQLNSHNIKHLLPLEKDIELKVKDYMRSIGYVDEINTIEFDFRQGIKYVLDFIYIRNSNP